MGSRSGVVVVSHHLQDARHHLFYCLVHVTREMGDVTMRASVTGFVDPYKVTFAIVSFFVKFDRFNLVIFLKKKNLIKMVKRQFRRLIMCALILIFFSFLCVNRKYGPDARSLL